jgi:tRNA threonylcarbamoyladenosine biosynthesis protein TsaE
MIHHILSTSPDTTRRIGQQLGNLLQASDLVALTGDLGAGKTCCIQGIARGLGIPDSMAVTSPTYTLIHEYQGRLPIYHFDVYRLTAGDDLYDLGYEEYFYGNGVTLIEWADRIRSFLPDDYVALHLGIQNDGVREIRCQAFGPRSETLITMLLQNVPDAIENERS